MEIRDTFFNDSSTVKKHGRSVLKTLKNLKPFERFVTFVLTIAVVISGTYILYTKNKGIFVEMPRAGGTHTEGIVGTPRFINPLLAISQADKDLSSLIYAGLMTRDEHGNLIPELAESYTISDDGTVYTFKLRDGLTFHDGIPLTADDVIFTIKQAANPAVRSPVFADWDGVQIEKIDDATISFTLPKPYAPFIENMTLGILPAHIWSLLSAEQFPFSQFNVTPVGSGPYKIGPNDVIRDKSGIPSLYRLTAFDEYTLGTPFISTIQFRLYNTIDDALLAYTKGEVNAVNSISPLQLEALQNDQTQTHTAVYRTPLLRIFGIFFNHNKQPIFLEDEVREALEVATPKKAVVGEILRGYGTVLNAPLPSFITGLSDESILNVEESPGESADERSPINHIEQARKVLENADWERGEDGIYTIGKDEKEKKLTFTLTTINAPELIQTAERIAESWREVGANVELKVFDPSDLTQSVIRPRRFDALLFGMVIGHELDLYAFWHSSQRNDPGLNIAQYADIETDALLEKMRTEKDPEIRKTLYADFTKLIQKQNAAVFVYAPDFVYVMNDRVQNVSLHPVKEPSERFDTAHLWHIETDLVWPFIQKILEH